MCGFAGIVQSEPRGEAELRTIAERMIEPIRHRGPDDRGSWVDPAAGVALGFRRLSIIDLSEQGHQPMHSAGGRYVMTFNGEVYNFAELREELEARGQHFSGHSDSEVILAAVESWGLDGALERFIGMFAIALWDRQARRLHLVRDRMGIKPLFVSAQRGCVVFGSELKALLAWPGFERSLDPEALTEYLRHLYVPAPRTIYARTIKLLPGHLLTISDPSVGLPASRPYWSLEDVARHGAAEPFAGTDDEAVDEAERLLSDASRLRLRADVPLGAFLSGGIDSSTVVALMQAEASRPVKTFTIGFDVGEHDETAHADAVARHLGTEHTSETVTAQDALDLIPRLPEMFDEPLADPSQMPTHLVSRMARREVTVAISGDGGDELLGGYNRYVYGDRLMSRMRRAPAGLRNVVGRGIHQVSTDSWDSLLRASSPLLPRSLRHRLPGDKLHKIGNLLRSPSLTQMYRSLVSAWQHPASLVHGGGEGPGPIERVLADRDDLGLVDRMLLADQLGYLPDDLLAKVDRASMAVSLEVRVPILDHRFVEYCWTLPASMKIRDGRGKWLLRQVLYRHVPAEIVDRPKVGFSVPIDAWLRGSLSPWAEELLSQRRLDESGVLRSEPIRRAWDSFKAGNSRLAQAMWTVLMFLSWQERWETVPR